MHAQLEELWIDAMEMKVGEQITNLSAKTTGISGDRSTPEN